MKEMSWTGEGLMPGVKTKQLRARLLRFGDLLPVPRHSGNTPGNTPQRLPARFSPPKGPGDWGLVDWAPPFSCQKLQTKLCVVDKAPTTSLPLELPSSLPARRTVTSPPVQLQAFGLRTATVAAVANMSKPDAANGNGTALNFKFVETPKAGPFTFEKSEDCGVRTTSVSSSGDLLACSSDPIDPPIGLGWTQFTAI